MTAPITMRRLIDEYQVLLLDAYGVLVDGSGALEGAVELVQHLSERGTEHLVITNDASRLPETIAGRLAGFGIPIEPDRVLTSGQLLVPHFSRSGLEGARCLVLGTDDSRRYVELAGGVVVEPDVAIDYDAIVVCDDDGYPFLETVNVALSVLYRMLGRGRDLALVLPNPDLVFPLGDGVFGITSGAVALLLEAAAERRYPRRNIRFTRLGKPHTPIFEEARRRAGTDSLVMIGDQLETDIAGAGAAGIDSALLPAGVTDWTEARLEPELSPTWILSSLTSGL